MEAVKHCVSEGLIFSAATLLFAHCLLCHCPHVRYVFLKVFGNRELQFCAPRIATPDLQAISQAAAGLHMVTLSTPHSNSVAGLQCV